MSRLAATWIALLLWLVPAAVSAEVERFALIVGNDRGDAGEQELRYAETDARRMRDVLRQIGAFEPANTLLLQGESAEAVRTSLISLNARIRQLTLQPDVQVIFLVYYSGHADATSLHLSGTRLPLNELRDLVRGSAATFRIAIMDACRSGTITRTKGGKVVHPFPLATEERLPGEGLAFLSASAADEDAQESDELEGSFFTHALVSGLMGAADANGDGEVVLDEAYRHAYDSTLRSTSRTWAGTQHPSYRYDFRGHGDLVLTRPGLHDGRRAHLELPSGVATLLMRGDASGTVVAEVGLHARSRTLSVDAGRYFVRARGADVMYEGSVDVAPGSSSQVTLDALEPIEYARLVRKGGGLRSFAHALELGVTARTPLPNAETPCIGGLLGYGIDARSLGLRVRLGICTASSENARIRTRLMAYGLDVRVYHAWDFGPLAVELGLGPGVTWFSQHFYTSGEGEDRDALMPHLAVGAAALLEVFRGTYLGLDLDAQTHLLVLDDGNAGEHDDDVELALRASLLMGRRF